MTEVASSPPLSSFSTYRRKQALAAIAAEVRHRSQPPRAGLTSAHRVDLVTAVKVLQRLTPSPDPVAVFTELAELLVPQVCDEAAAAVHVGDGLTRWQQLLRDADLPVVGTDPTGSGWTVTLDVPARHPGNDAGPARPDYVAVLTCRGRGPAPTSKQVTVIDLAARYAAVLVQQTRQSHLVQQQEQQLSSLRTALQSNRRISAAVGVLMANQQLAYEDAFSLLRETSQNTNSKLSAVADTVLRTGRLSAHP